jgi:hypothetical protein
MRIAMSWPTIRLKIRSHGRLDNLRFEASGFRSYYSARKLFADVRGFLDG